LLHKLDVEGWVNDEALKRIHDDADVLERKKEFRLKRSTTTPPRPPLTSREAVTPTPLRLVPAAGFKESTPAPNVSLSPAAFERASSGSRRHSRTTMVSDISPDSRSYLNAAAARSRTFSGFSDGVVEAVVEQDVGRNLGISWAAEATG
jgi:hypothetical protein